jgi:hypothetical protein
MKQWWTDIGWKGRAALVTFGVLGIALLFS